MNNMTDEPFDQPQTISIEQWGKLFRVLAETHPQGPLGQIATVLDILSKPSDVNNNVLPATPDHECQELQAKAWEVGVATALNHAIRNEDGITLRLEHLDGRPWKNPYREHETGDDAEPSNQVADTPTRTSSYELT